MSKKRSSDPFTRSNQDFTVFGDGRDVRELAKKRRALNAEAERTANLTAPEGYSQTSEPILKSGDPGFLFRFIQNEIVSLSPEEADALIEERFSDFSLETIEGVKNANRKFTEREESKIQAEALEKEQKAGEDEIMKLNEDLKNYVPEKGSNIIQERLFLENFDPKTGKISQDFKDYSDALKVVEEHEKKLYSSRVSESTTKSYEKDKKDFVTWTKTSKLADKRDALREELAQMEIGRYGREIQDNQSNLLQTIISGANNSTDPNKLFKDLTVNFPTLKELEEGENVRAATEAYKKKKLELKAIERELGDHTSLEASKPSTYHKVLTQGLPGIIESGANAIIFGGNKLAQLFHYGSSLIGESYSKGISKQEYEELKKAREIVDNVAKPKVLEMFRNEYSQGLKESIANINEELNYDENHPHYINPEEIPDTPKEFIEWTKNQPALLPSGMLDFSGGETISNLGQMDNRLAMVKFNGTKSDYTAFGPIRDIIGRYKNAAERIDTYTKEGGVLTDLGLGSVERTAEGMVSERLSFFDIANNMKKLSIVKNARDKKEDLTALEMAELKSVVTDIQSKGVNTDFSFSVGQTVTGSATMMAEQGFNYAILKRIPYLNKLFATLLSGGMSPSALGAAADAYASQVDVLRDPETGEEIALATEKDKYEFVERVKILAQATNDLINGTKSLEYDLYKKEEELGLLYLSPEAQEEIKKNISKDLQLEIENKKELIEKANIAIGTIVGDDGRLNSEETSLVKSLLKGGLSMASEAFIERYGGAFLSKAGTRTRSLLTKPVIPSSRIGRAVSAVDRVVTKTGVKLDKLTDKTYLTRGSKKLYNFLYKSTGSDKIIHGIWEEFGEEVLQSLIPQIGEDYQEQLDEFTTAKFWKTVALSTGITIGGMNAASKSVKMARDFSLSEKEKEAVKEAKTKRQIREDRLNGLFDSINEGDLSTNILDIVASNSSSSTVDKFYTEGLVADLRNLKKPFKDAKGNLLSEGERIAQANSIETQMMISSAFEASALGESEKFQRVMGRVARNPKVDQNTRLAAAEAVRTSQAIDVILENNEGKINVGEIRRLQLEREEALSIKNKNKSYKESFKEDFKNVIDNFNSKRAKAGLPEFTFEEVVDLMGEEVHNISKTEIEKENTPANHVDFYEYYNSLNDSLRAGSEQESAFQNYELGRLMEASTQDWIEEVEKDLNWEMSSNNAKEIEKREKSRIAKELLDSVTAENAEQVKKILKERQLDTPENIVAINAKVINLDNSPGINNNPSTTSVPNNVITETEAEERTAAAKVSQSEKVVQANKELLEKVKEEEAKAASKKKQSTAKPDSKVDQAEIDAIEQEVAPEVSQAEIDAVEAQTTPSDIETQEAEIERRRREELEQAKKAWSENVDERGFPREALPPILKEINAKYDAEIDEIEEAAVGESEMTQEDKDQLDIAESDDISFAPIMRDPKSNSQNNFVKSLADELKKFLKDYPKSTFKGFFAGYASDIGMIQAEQTFNLIGEAWEEATGVKFEEGQLESLYSEFFYSPTYFKNSQQLASSNTSAVAVEPTPSQSDESSLPTPKEIHDTDNSNSKSSTIIDPSSGQVVEENFVQRDERQFEGVAPKIGVLARVYEALPDGKEEVTNDIREEAEPYMDYRNMKIGDEVQMVFDFESLLAEDSTIDVWSDLDKEYLSKDSEKPKRKAVPTRERLTALFKGVEGLNSWEEIQEEIRKVASISELIAEGKATEQDIEDLKNSILFQNEEFLKIAPVGLVNKGYTDKTDNNGNPKRIISGGMSDYHWFNNANVALKVGKQGDNTVVFVEERKKRIEENKAINLAIRDDILSSGSHSTTIAENRDATNNVLLPRDKFTFNSLLSQFGGIEEFHKHAAVAYLDNGTLIGEEDNNGKKIKVRIGGVEINDANTPNLQATLEGIKNSGKNGIKITSGRNIFIVRTGTDSNGGPIFTAHNMISNHSEIQEKSEKYSQMLSEVFSAMADRATDNKREKKAKRELRKKFEKIFGYSLDSKDMQILKGMNPFMSKSPSKNSAEIAELRGRIQNLQEALASSEGEELREEIKDSIRDLENILNNSTSDTSYRQDFKPRYHRKGSKYNSLPNFENFDTVEDFFQALEIGNKEELVKNGIEDMLGNYHTNLVFNPITNNGETIYTNGSQPIITFDVAPILKKRIEERARKIQEESDRLKSVLDTQERLLKDADTPEEKRQLKTLISETKKEIRRINSLSSENNNNLQEVNSQLDGNNNQGDIEEGDAEPGELPVPEDFSVLDKQDIMNRLLADTISSIDIFGELSLQDIYREAESKYDLIIQELRDNNKDREADFMEESRDSILGKQGKEGSIREYIELVIGVEEDTEMLDDVGTISKQVGKSSFELDARMGIRSKAKLMFFGIPDTRYGTGFGGFSSYLTPFEALEALQQIISSINNNSLVSVNEAIEARVKTNPLDLGFFNDIKDKLEKINKTNPDIVDELLYTLYTPPVEMLFTMHSRNTEGITTIETYDANVRNPKIVKRNRWSEQIKLNGLLDLHGEGLFKINPKKSKEAKELFKRLTEGFEKNGNSVDNSMRPDLIRYLHLFGVRLNSKTLNNLFEKKSQNDIDLEGYLFGDRFAIINNLHESLVTLEGHEASGRILGFNNSSDKRGTVLKTNPLTLGNSKINDLIAADNSVEFIPSSSNYLGGKTVNSRQQPNAITTKMNNIKNALYVYGKALEEDPDVELPADLKIFESMAITSNSFILERLKSNPIEMAKYFDHSLFSLEAIINKNDKNRDDKGISNLSDRDLLLAVLGQFASSEGEVTDLDFTERYGIKLRKGIMAFPTIADSGQMPLLKTILLDLKNSDIDKGTNEISDGVLRLLADQLLYPDLLRMADYNLKIGENTSNISGYDLGSQFISGMPSLQFLELKDEEGNLVMLPLAFNRFLKEQEIEDIDAELPDLVREFIDIHREDIDRRMNETLNQEAENFYNDLVKENLIDEKGRLTISDGKVKNSYFSKDAKLVSYDFAINYALQQKEIQNIFAGDLAMYFSDKMGRGLKYGVPTIPFSELLESYYPGEEAAKTVEEILDGKTIKEVTDPSNKEDEEISEIRRELFESFPILEYSDEFIDSEADASRAYEIYLPLMREKFNDIYKGVQNNLSKRLQGLISPGNRLANIKNQSDILQVMVQDMETISKTFMNLAESRYGKKVIDEIRPMVEEYHSLDEIYHKNEIQKARHKELGDNISEKVPLVAAYLKTAETDAQEYMSWREALVQLEGQGRIPKDLKESIRNKIEKQAEELNSGKEISEENKLSERELEVFSGQPTKPLYAGTITSDINGHLANRFVYIKSSAFPLIPELTQMFPEFDKIRRNMEFLEDRNPGKTVRLSYQTANKVGAVKSPVSINDLHGLLSELSGEELEKKLDAINSSSLILKREGHSIQQDVPSEYDSKGRNVGTRATQFEKIILGDRISQIKENIFPASSFDKSLLSDLGIKVDEKTENINGVDLKNIYREIYKREQKILFDNLLSELNASSFEDVENGNVATMEAYADKINQKLTSKQDKDMIELLYQARDAEGKLQIMDKGELESSGLVADRAFFRFPVFMTPNSRKLESVMLSMVSKNSINLTMPAFSSPVASERGFTYKGYNRADFEKALERGLVVSPNFNPDLGLTSTVREDGIRYAQVFVPNKYQIYNSEAGRYELVDFKEYTNNGVIDLDKIPEELLSMFSFRIPTSSHQSGMVIEVAGVLPSEMRDLMVVPKDSTIQIGEDFDIDKRYVYQYNLVKDLKGDIKKMSYSDIEKPSESYYAVKNKFEEAKRNNWSRFFQMNLESADLRNPYLESNKETIYELVWVQDAIDNYLADKIISRVFKDAEPGEDYSSLSLEELNQLKTDLESKIIPKDATQEKRAELIRDYREIREFLTEVFNDKGGELREAWNSYNHYKEAKTNELRVLENNLLSMYKAVFSSPSEEVHNLITKVLSTEFSEESAEVIDEKLAEKDKFFLINSFKTQRKIMALGADGKAGIGKHSNSVTLHSLFQQSDVPLALFTKGKEYDPIIGGPVEFRKGYDIVLGEYTFTGELGKIYNEKSGTRISEYLMESQNSATDNQKLEIMGRRNENPETMGVFSLLQMMGIEDSSINYKGNTRNISYASMFISQPAIIDIASVAKEKDSVSQTGEEGRNARRELMSLIPKSAWSVDKTGKVIAGVLKSQYEKEAGKFITGQGLYNMIGKEYSEMSPEELIAQYYIMSNYMKFKGAARQLSDVQKIINIENKGLGISMFDTIDLTMRLKNLHKINIVPVVELGTSMNETNGSLMEELIGEVSDTKLSEDFIKIDDGFYIKPKTHFGHKIVSSISLANGLIGPLFPYNKELIATQIKSIALETGVEEGTEEFVELQYDIINSMKDYSFSNIRTLFKGGIEAHQRDLFFDDREGGKESLGSYILRLREQAAVNPKLAKLLKLPLFRDMQIEVKDKTMPTIIKYNSDNLDKLSSTMSYNILSELSKSETELPSRNGREMTEAILLKELFMYSLIADQANGAIGFRHLIPADLFKESRVDTIMRGRNSPDNYISHINYGGTVRTIETMMGSKMNIQGVIPFNSSKGMTEASIKVLVANANRFALVNSGQEQAFSVDNNLNVVYNYFNNTSNSSRIYQRQYIQHNPQKVRNVIKSANMDGILSYNRYSFQDLMEDKINTLAIPTKSDYSEGEYLVIDMGYELRLYEKFDSIESPSGDIHHYKRIPLLGSFGYNEYNAGVDVNKSNIPSNNFDASWGATSILNSPTAKGGEINLESVLKNILNDKNNPYNELTRILSLFLPQIEGLSLDIKSGLKGAGQYNKRTKTISISQEVADRGNTSEINDVVAEELLHAATTEIFNRYIEIEGLNEKGELVYKNITSDPLPAPLQTLISIYNSALKHYSNKHGFKNLMDSIESIQKKKDNMESQDVSEGIELDSYRLQDINEFIAGIFIKNKEFSKEMNNTPYMSSGKSILARFAEALAKLFHRLIPEARKDSFTAATAESLLELISSQLGKEVPIRKSNVPSLKSVSERLDSIADSTESDVSVEEGQDITEEGGSQLNERINKDNENDIPSPCDGGPSM